MHDLSKFCYPNGKKAMRNKPINKSFDFARKVLDTLDEEPLML